MRTGRPAAVLAAACCAAWLAVAGAAAAAAAGEESAAATVPRPLLDKLEKPVQEYLEAERAAVVDLVAREAPPAALSAAFGRLGRFYLVHEFPEEATACFLRAIEEDPEEFAWHYYLGALYNAQGELEKAEASLGRAVALAPDDLPARLRLARTELDLGLLERAEASFRAALDLDPESAAAHFGLGRLAFERGDWERAAAEFERALELQPEANQIHYSLGLAYREQGDLERAREHLQQNRQKAVRFADPLMEGLHELVRSAKLHFDSAWELLGRNQLEAAILQLRMAVEKQPENFLYHHNLASALVAVGQEDEAILGFRHSLRINPEYRDSHYNLATLLAKRGLDREAAEHFERAHRLDPDDPAAHLEWATALSRLGQPEQAAGELEKLLEMTPDYPEALVNLATLQARLGRLAEAEETLLRVLEGEAEGYQKAEAHFRLARIREQQQDPRALDHYRQAIELDPALGEAHRRLAELLGRQGSFEEAARAFEQALALDGGDPRVHFGHALALLLAERYEEVRIELEKSLQLHPGNVPLTHLLARVLATAPAPQARDGERALALATEVFSVEQTLDHAETIAMAYAELGRFDEAVRWQQDVLTRAEGSLGADALAPIRRRLASYRERQPCRAPWKGG